MIDTGSTMLVWGIQHGPLGMIYRSANPQKDVIKVGFS